MITKGLYFHHFGTPLTAEFYPDVAMFHPEREPALWAGVAYFFPDGSARVRGNLGRGVFLYEGAQSAINAAFTAWRMAWHNGIPLHGDGAPLQGITVFCSMTRPTVNAVAEEKARRAQLIPSSADSASPQSVKIPAFPAGMT